jgi:hypothetical protein
VCKTAVGCRENVFIFGLSPLLLSFFFCIAKRKKKQKRKGDFEPIAPQAQRGSTLLT